MEQTRHRRGAKSPPPKPKDKGGAEAPSQSDLRVYKSLHERGRRSTSTPTQPQVLTTPRRASRGPTKVDYVFRWRFTSFTSKGPRHQGAVWRLRLSNKEQGAYLKAYLRRWRKHQLDPSSKEVFDLSRLRATFPQRVLSSPSFSRTHHHPLTTDHGL